MYVYVDGYGSYTLSLTRNFDIFLSLLRAVFTVTVTENNQHFLISKF